MDIQARSMASEEFRPYLVEERRRAFQFQIDGLAIVGVAFFVFLAWQLLRSQDLPAYQSAATDTVPTTVYTTASNLEGEESLLKSQADPVGEDFIKADPATIRYPYDDFWISQGLHGGTYGHMAIDIVAGKGAAIKAPIQGTVSANYIDQFGNTTLIIENERYRVTLLHGNYSVPPGQEIMLGQVIGNESNNGYTTDIYGNSCWDLDCGYHTHINVFDRELGENINPLEVLSM